MSGIAVNAVAVESFLGLLSALTGRLVSDAFGLGFVSGLLLGVLECHLVAFAFSLGAKNVDKSLFYVCVIAGGVMGDLIRPVLHRRRRASFRSRMRMLVS